MPLYLNQSAAKQHFKNVLGQANHLIITNLVGLDAIEQGLVKEAPSALHAIWSPKNPIVSARRSRRMLLDMALVRSVDSLDIYIRHCRRTPQIIQDSQLQASIDAAGLSIYKKIIALENAIPELDKVLLSLITLMITWRNRAAHFEADIKLDSKKLNILNENKERIEAEYSGLETDKLLDDFENSDGPTFRETASLIRATHEFVKNLENILLTKLSPEEYLKQTIRRDINSVEENKSDYSKRRLQGIWGRDPSDRENYLIRYFINLGLSKTAKEGTRPAVFKDELISKLSSFNTHDTYEWLGINSE